MGKDKDHHFHLTVLIPQAGLLRAWPTMLPSRTMKGHKREGEREAPLKRKTNEAKYLASVSGVSSLTLWGRGPEDGREMAAFGQGGCNLHTLCPVVVLLNDVSGLLSLKSSS